MAQKTENCWEVIECNVKEDCPAFKQNLGGRCFAVTGTLCRGEKQGEYKEKIDQCRDGCPFYDKVIRNG